MSTNFKTMIVFKESIPTSSVYMIKEQICSDAFLLAFIQENKTWKITT